MGTFLLGSSDENKNNVNRGVNLEKGGGDERCGGKQRSDNILFSTYNQNQF